jgi:Flp pilus assembly protein TadB
MDVSVSAAAVCGLVVLVAGPVPRLDPSPPTVLVGPVAGPLDAARLGVVVGAVAVVVGLAAGSPLLVGPTAAVAVVVGRLVEPVRTRRRARRRRAQVTDLVDAVSRSVRSGATLSIALDEARRDGIAPLLEGELGDLEARIRAGRALPLALDDWSRSADDADLRLLAGTVAVLAAAGGAAGPALDAAARTLRARTAAEAEV